VGSAASTRDVGSLLSRVSFSTASDILYLQG
jgi:hypothetical protein